MVAKEKPGGKAECVHVILKSILSCTLVAKNPSNGKVAKAAV